ncbi:MAG TPA: DUF5668 domain-containing protein [Candidatus Dormibacteraeota bacterium]
MGTRYDQPPHEQPPPYDPRSSYRHPRWRTRGVGFGVLLILVGLWALLQNLGVLAWVRWDVFWPLVVIAFGIWVIIRRSRFP